MISKIPCDFSDVENMDDSEHPRHVEAEALKSNGLECIED